MTNSTLVGESYTHNLFPYPAKFPAAPIREILLKYSAEGDTVLDPFCGSGTVLVEALLQNRNAIGIELNPVSALVAKTKATLYTPEQIGEVGQVLADLNDIERERERWLDKTVSPIEVPTYKNIDLWFQSNMIRELAGLRKVFLYQSKYTEPTKNLLWTAFLRIIVPVSNQDTDTRYTAISKPEIVDGYAIRRFKDTLASYHKVLSDNAMLTGLLAGDSPRSAQVFEGDTLVELSKLNTESLDLVITSPPYINTFDYYLYHKHRIFWMGRDPQKIRQQEVGCHHRIDTMSYVKAVGEYRRYLGDVMILVHRTLKPGKRFVLLIGDGIVKGESLLADELIRDLAKKTNFTVEEVTTTSLRQVSKGFIKGKTLDLKKHHTMVLQSK